LRRDVLRQIAQKKVLEDAARAFHSGRKLLVTDLDDVVRNLPQAGRIFRRHVEPQGEDDPFLVPFEDALPVGELALRVAEHADSIAIEKPAALYPFADGMTIGSRVAIDRSPNPSGDAGKGFEPLETVQVAEIHQVLQHRARLGDDVRALCRKSV